MAEWLKAAVLKTASRFTGRGFKSYSLRHPSLKLRMALPICLYATVDVLDLRRLARRDGRVA